MNYKQAKKHNKELSRKYANDEITWDEKEDCQVDLVDLVINKLESDENLNKFHFILFHIRNKNGAREMLPKLEDFCFTDEDGNKKYWHGTSIIYSQLDNFHSRKLSEYFAKHNLVKWRDIKYTVQSIKEDVEEYKKWKKQKEEDKAKGEVA